MALLWSLLYPTNKYACVYEYILRSKQALSQKSIDFWVSCSVNGWGLLVSRDRIGFLIHQYQTSFPSAHF